MRANDPPYPDHPLFNWDFQWHPTASPQYSTTQYELTAAEKDRLSRKEKRAFGFAAALDAEGPR